MTALYVALSSVLSMLTTKQLTIGAGYISAPYFMGVWCNGNTTSSNLVDVGSIPTTSANYILRYYD